MTKHWNDHERSVLLELARNAIQVYLSQEKSLKIRYEDIPHRLLEPRATFVTLTKSGILRGCVGSLEPNLPLVDDVCQHAVASATQDYRFPPVSIEEIHEINIEISVLTIPERLDYETPDELLRKLRPNIDGVVIWDGYNRATFLPQVWKKLPQKDVFLERLCQKLGASPNHWMTNDIEIYTYQVEEFDELSNADGEE
jgi:AmmeMemoRadiSam system protein A